MRFGSILDSNSGAISIAIEQHFQFHWNAIYDEDSIPFSIWIRLKLIFSPFFLYLIQSNIRFQLKSNCTWFSPILTFVWLNVQFHFDVTFSLNEIGVGLICTFASVAIGWSYQTTGTRTRVASGCVGTFATVANPGILFALVDIVTATTVHQQHVTSPYRCKKKKKNHYKHTLPFFRWHLRPAGLVNYIHHYSWIDLMNEVRDLLASARETSRRVQTVAVTASVIDSALVKICQRNINIGDCTDRSWPKSRVRLPSQCDFWPVCW